MFKMIFAPVDNMNDAVRFLSEQCGMKLRIRDGERYADFKIEGLTLALLGEGERVAGEATMGVVVNDLALTLDHWRHAGAEIIGDIKEGAHEISAVARTPGGLLLTASQKRATK